MFNNVEKIKGFTENTSPLTKTLKIAYFDEESSEGLKHQAICDIVLIMIRTLKICLRAPQNFPALLDNPNIRL